MKKNIRVPLRRHTLALAALCATAGTSYAQSTQSTMPEPVAAPRNTIVITGNPLGQEEVAAPVSVLTGDQLVLKRGSSLGETLDGMPGVSSSYFGPNANRPVIRGQDGDRIRVLSNAGASLDASSLSFDHAVPIDPLVVERVEVLRGPAALLYGGSAVGGVVNAIDNRIPRDRIDGPSGAAELRFGGAASERGASGLVETGGNGFALHADGFWRKTDDLRVPAFDRPLDGGGTERRTRVVNSASDAGGGAVGGSLVGEHGYFGASFDTYRNVYGPVAEEDVSIHMRRNKLALAGELRDLGGFVTTVRGQLGYTDYQHQEVEGSGAVGTTFKNKGSDARFEAVHRPLPLGAGELQGVFGLQAATSEFAALGEEAFVPTTHSRELAGFLLEQWGWGKALQLSAGLRAEHVRVDSDGDADPADARFGPARQRGFTPRSGSLGMVYKFAPQWELSGSWAYTERAPTSYELYANGVHAATATFERGDLQQTKERGRNLDVSLQWKQGADHLKLGAFVSRFSNYIALVRSSDPDVVDGTGASFPIYDFRGVRARLYGMELEGSWRLLKQGPRTLDLDGHVDWVRGDDLTTGEPLPRIAPVRATVGLNWQQAAWTARAEVQRAQRQSRVSSDDIATPGWTQLNLSASYKTTLGSKDALLFVKLGNLGNQLAYNAATIATVRELSPLPGRALTAGLRVVF